MEVINITVRNKIAKNDREYDAEYVCGNSDYVIVFDFDEEWNAFEAKTARFKYDGRYQDVVFTGNQVNIPVIENAHVINVGVFAGNLCTTTPAVFTAKKSILCGSGTPAAPSNDVYNQIMDLVQRCLDDEVSEEDIQKAVEKYLKENPVDTVGIPPGGKVGQYLRKKSDADWDVEWGDLEIPEQYGLVTYDQDKTITIT